MLKFIFIILILANLFIGYFTFTGYGEKELHEPERLTNQLNPEKLILLPVDYDPGSAGNIQEDKKVAVIAKAVEELEAEQPKEPLRVVDDVKKQTPVEKPLVCIRTAELTKNIASDLRTYVKNEGLRNNSIELHKNVVQNYITYIPARQGKLGSTLTVKGLQQAGVTDYYVLKENSDFPWAVSLGIFSTEAAAHAQRVSVQTKGLTNIIVRPFKSKVVTVFRISGLNENQARGIREIVKSSNIEEQSHCSKP